MVCEKDLSDSEPLSDSCLLRCDSTDLTLPESGVPVNVLADMGVDERVGVMVWFADSNDSAAYSSLGESFLRVSSLEASVRGSEALCDEGKDVDEKLNKLILILGLCFWME